MWRIVATVLSLFLIGSPAGAGAQAPAAETVPSEAATSISPRRNAVVKIPATQDVRRIASDGAVVTSRWEIAEGEASTDYFADGTSTHPSPRYASMAPTCHSPTFKTRTSPSITEGRGRHVATHIQTAGSLSRSLSPKKAETYCTRDGRDPSRSPACTCGAEESARRLLSVIRTPIRRSGHQMVTSSS